MLVKESQVLSLLHELQLTERITVANPRAKKRFIVRAGVARTVPFSLVSALRTPLFSFPAKLRILAEPWQPAPDQADESVASFVRRRLGPEFLEYAVGPMCSGVYAGDPEHLSIRSAFPKVWALENAAGSLIRGSLRLRRERRKSGEAAFRGQLLSFRDGLVELPRSLHRELRADVELEAPLTRLERNPDGRWEATWTQRGATFRKTFKSVVLTPDPQQWKAEELDPVISRALRDLPVINRPPVSTLTLGFCREAVAHPLDGFGLLIPRSEGFPLLGCIFSSTLFPGRAPDGHVALTVFRGGATAPQEALMPEAEAVRETVTALKRLVGVRGSPVFHHYTRWPRAIPQYNVGHGTFIAGIEAIERAHRGLYFQGNYRGGPGLSDCISNALILAERI